MSTTPKVQYAYADGSANTIRPTSLMYPNGRVLNANYATSGGIDDSASRVASLIDNDGTTHLADYSYLGAAGIVIDDYAQPQIRYTLASVTGSVDPVTGDIYTGLDLFSRVKDLRWYNYGTSTDAVRIQHGYDRASNRLWRADAVAEAASLGFDELYAYDGLYRLKSMQRGTLNGSQTAIVGGTATFGQCWTLDATGNWKGFREDDTGSGTWDLVQSRTANTVNEITNITNSVGSAWANPVYDPNGNMTSLPQPAAPTSALTGTFDAWNRLVELVDATSGNTVQKNAYDALRRRTAKQAYTSGTLSETRHLYYSSAWQVLEERVGTSSNAERQFAWGLRYIDDLILRDRDTTGGGTLNERFYALQDPNWNVVGLSDASGNIQERYSYDPYGMPTFLTAAFGSRSSSNYAWETLYAGYRYDADTGLYLARNRFFDSATGTWLTRDRAGQLTRLYEYCMSNAIRLVDPFGRDGLEIEVVPVDETDPPITGPIWWSGLVVFGEIEPTSVEEMVDEIIKKVGTVDTTGKSGNCIKSITIRSHGGTGYINIGKKLGPNPDGTTPSSTEKKKSTTRTSGCSITSRAINPNSRRNDAAMRAALAKLKPLMCDSGAKITLYSCFTARDPSVMQYLADLTGATVEGTTDNTGWSIIGCGNWVSVKPSEGDFSEGYGSGGDF